MSPMAWNLNSERPIYSQIMERITFDIISGIYPPGSQLPSVRALAQDAGVNPNTMQKAMAELERTGLIYSQRTSGRFITEDLGMIDKTKNPSSVEVLGKFRRFHFLFFLLLSLIFDFPFIYAKFSNALLGLFLLKNFLYML